MPDPGANLWISQANSDWRAADLVYDETDHRTYCQAISKYQQTVEKSIKAVAAALQGAGVKSVRREYYYDHNLDDLISALRRSPYPRKAQHVQARICEVLSDYYYLEINALSSLAPRKPQRGALHARNTEYPYESAQGVWTAPALLGEFNKHEVLRFYRLAERIYERTREIVSAIDRYKKTLT